MRVLHKNRTNTRVLHKNRIGVCYVLSVLQALVDLAFHDVHRFSIPVSFANPFFGSKSVLDAASLLLLQFLLMLEQDLIHIASCLHIVSKQFHAAVFVLNARCEGLRESFFVLQPTSVA